MNIHSLSLEEKIELALNTTEKLILEMLSLSPSMLVRRAVLRNSYITSDIVDILTYDSVENVSYLASTHTKCTKKRDFEENLSKCVTCTIDERDISCTTCPY